MSPTIIQEAKKPDISVIQLIEAELTNGIRLYWSNTYVPSDYFVTSTTLTTTFTDLIPSYFEPRIISIDTIKWELLPDTSSMSIEIANHVEGFEDLSDLIKRYGFNAFYNAKVHYHILFPNLKEAYGDFWVGYGSYLEYREGVYTWNLDYGFSSLRRRFGRRLNITCPHIFADNWECRYKLNEGRGYPEILQTTTVASIVDSTTLTTADNLVGGEYAIVATTTTQTTNEATLTVAAKDCYMRVVSASGTTLKYEKVWGDDNPEVGDVLWIGNSYKSCPKTLNACKERGRYVPIYGDKRTDFGGGAPAANVYYTGKVPEEGGDGTWFRRARLEGETFADRTIPVIYGYFRVRDYPAAWYAPAGAFHHGLFLLCEGQVLDVRQPIINGYNPDDSATNRANLVDVVQNDSLIVWGVYGITPEEQRIVDERSLYWVRNCVGSRGSEARWSGLELDFYGLGVNGRNAKGQLIRDVGNPFLFNNGKGEGVSLDGLTALRIRIQTDSDESSGLSGMFDVAGKFVRVPPAAKTTRDGDFGSFGSWRYTARPNHALVALDILLHRRYGAGLDDNEINWDSFAKASDFCEELIAENNLENIKITGTVKSGSGDKQGTNYSGSWLWISGLYTTGSLNGYRITITSQQTGASFTTTIRASVRFPVVSGQDGIVQGTVPGYYAGVYLDGFSSGESGTFIVLDYAPFEPKSGDTFVIEAAGMVPRYAANGAIATDRPIGDVIADVLDEAGMNGRVKDGKIDIVIRRKLTPAELDYIVANRLFTDRGPKRNVIRDRSGQSTLHAWQEGDLPNVYSARFVNAQSDYTGVNVQVMDDQLVEGEQRNEKGVELMLTTSLDQAARRLALLARETRIANLYCEFETSIGYAIDIYPGDVIAVDSSIFDIFVPKAGTDIKRGGAFFFRVLKKELTGDFKFRLSCKVHVNDIYDDTANAFGEYFEIESVEYERVGIPVDVKVVELVESVEVTHDGKAVSVITATIEFPGVG